MQKTIINQNNKTELPLSYWRFIDLVYPPTCCYCGRIGFEICPNCFSEIETIGRFSTCKICGQILYSKKKCDCYKQIKPAFDMSKSWGMYSGVLRIMIQKIKYSRGFGLVEYIASYINKSIESWEVLFNVIIPVPLGKKKYSKRGYNQSVILAKPISDHFKQPLDTKALFRVRETRSQYELGIEERKENVKGAFVAETHRCKNKSILLVDDVATTCSTQNECAKALKRSGAKQVFCFTVARTPNLT